MQLAKTIEDFMAGYFSTRGRSEKTKAAYGTDLAQLRGDFGADKPLNEIDADALEQWAREMRSRGYAPVSIRRKFATIRVFFKYWIRKGDLDKSPLWNIRLDLEPQRLLPRSLTASDMQRLIAQVWSDVELMSPTLLSPRDPRFLALRNVALIEILFATGMRVGELVSLGIRDWHDDESLFVVMGKGRRQRLALIPDERSRTAVKTYLLQRMAMNLGQEGLFVNPSGKRLSSQGAARVVVAAAKSANIEIRVTPHMIRHTVATLLLRCGADIRIVQEVLGHASIATTQRYTYVSKEHLFSTLRIHHPNNYLKFEFQARSKQLVLPLY